MAEGYLLYSSLTLAVMGCLTLSLSILFRQRSRPLTSLPRDPLPTVFDRTFNIFDPYPLQKKIIHRFLTVLPLAAGLTSFALLVFLMAVVYSGLVLSALIVIVGLNLIIIEEAPDVYGNCKTFSKAIQGGTAFANGDLKVLGLIKKLAPKLSNYYFGLSVLFFGFGFALPYVSATAPWLFNQLIDSIIQSSGPNGILVLEAVGLILAVNLALLQYVAFWVKNKMFKYEV